MLSDRLYALRQWQRAPGYATVAILTLGLGIGLNTAAFSVAYGVLMRPLPYPSPERILHLSQEASDGAVAGPAGTVTLTIAEYQEWERRFRVFESTAIYTWNQASIFGAGEPGIIGVAAVSTPRGSEMPM